MASIAEHRAQVQQSRHGGEQFILGQNPLVGAVNTERLRPFVVDGHIIHKIGMPGVLGREGYARGDVANVLLAITGDANTSIHSTKATTCNIRPGRLAHRGGRGHGQ